MGARGRMRQRHLAAKLLHIRLALGLSQSGMLRRVGFEGVIDYKRISEYELGRGEPPLAVLLSYARVIGVSTDVLIDDELDLPDKLPGRVRFKT